MKKLLLIPILLLSMISCTEAQEASFSAEALNSKMTTLDGKEVAFKDILKQYKGKTIVIDVWASWCPDCAKGMPKVHDLQKQFPDAVYLFLSYDRVDDAWKKGIEKYSLQKDAHYHAGTSMKEGTFAPAIKLDWIPRYMVVDKNGKIALFKAIEADDEKLIATLKNLK
jgi:thiol-disulfide isomerase/thioredoxin